MAVKPKILIADDSDLNIAIISEILKDRYQLVVVHDGNEALKIMTNSNKDIDLLLLDLVMPNKDGISVLKEMNETKLIKDIPVIIISSETSPDVMNYAYSLGAEDFITRPFHSTVVLHRVKNTIILHAKQKKLIDIVLNNYKEKERLNGMMISILSHIVEYRNGESGLHVIHINVITGLLLKALVKRTNKYKINESDIRIIKSASSFHDVGKIAIPSEILNKPGRLTKEEFEIMKTHSMVGAEMLSNLDAFSNEPLVKYSYQICRHHHERYDGKGYPDGLVGDNIPIAAQAVSLADVYDALTSKRCYKDAYSHEQAIKMILNGECGTFNPLLIDCLHDIDGELKALSENKTSFSLSLDEDDSLIQILRKLEKLK